MPSASEIGFSIAASLRAVARPTRPEAALLFDTARDPDPVTRFLREDAPALDWRSDFLRSAAMEAILVGIESEIEDAQEEDIAISQRDVATTGSGFVAD